MSKPEITIKSISGGVRETIDTGEYPNYYTLWSRKYKRSWRLCEFPVSLKVKGEIVYYVTDEFTVLDKKEEKIEDVEFIIEMHD